MIEESRLKYMSAPTSLKPLEIIAGEDDVEGRWTNGAVAVSLLLLLLLLSTLSKPSIDFKVLLRDLVLRLCTRGG